MRLKLKTPATTYPLTLDEAKDQCRVTGTAEDTLIQSYIQAAALHIENVLGRSLMPQTWQAYMDTFQDSMLLPRSPVQSVTSVQYYDPDGNLQLLPTTNYAVDNVDEEGPAWVVKATNTEWPLIAVGINNVIIEYVAGYIAVPDDIKHAAKLLVEHFYDNRAPVLTSRSANASIQLDFTVDALLANHRMYW